MTQFINPHRGEGEYWLIFDTQEGGPLRITGSSPEHYMKVIEDGYLKIKTGDFDPEPIFPSFIQLVKCIDGYDFVLREINKANGQT
jgi:hypothetical protein